jgi:hypothetical protein
VTGAYSVDRANIMPCRVPELVQSTSASPPAGRNLSRSKIVNRSWWRLVATKLSASRPGRAGVAGTVAAARVACASVLPGRRPPAAAAFSA